MFRIFSNISATQPSANFTSRLPINLALQPQSEQVTASVAASRSEETCLTCSTPCPSIPTPTLSAEKDQENPQKQQKQRQPPTFRTPCCLRPICSACIARNPRIVQYVPCLWCGEGVGVASSKRGMKAGLRDGRQSAGRDDGGGQEDVFVLGGDDGDEDEGTDDSPPPAYQENGSSRSTITGDIGRNDTNNGAPMPTSPPPGIETDEQPPYQPPVKRHRVLRGETVRSLATLYGVDPYLLAKTNGLPYSSLTTHPGVLQTRREVLVPSSQSTAGNEDPLEDEKRRRERMAKRFQLITKETDPYVARTYVAIHSSATDTTTSSDDPAAEDQRTADYPTDDTYEQHTSGEKPELAGGREKEKVKQQEKMTPGGTTRGGVSSAIEMFYADEEWEASTLPSGASGRLRSRR